MIELLLCTVVWGLSFLIQKIGSEYLGPFSVNSYRNLIAAAFLFGIVCLRAKKKFESRKATYVGGTLSGICLFFAMMCQQVAFEDKALLPGVSAFLTANYIFLVPVFSLFVGKRPAWLVWLGVALALVGTYFLSFASLEEFETLSLGAGEMWTLACAFLFAVQMMIVDRCICKSDPWRFSMVQMLVAGLVALPFVFLPSETARLAETFAAEGDFISPFVCAVLSVLFLGIGSSALGYTLQNLGQAKVPVSTASIVMSLEGVFAVLSGWLVLDNVLTVRQSIGCTLIFTAVIVASCRREAALQPKRKQP